MKRFAVLIVVLMIVAGGFVASSVDAQNEPIALGTPVELDGSWSATIVKVFADPSQIDPTAEWFLNWLEDNPRAAGSEFFTVSVFLTNIGHESLSPSEIQFGFVATSGATYDFRSNCGSVPNSPSFNQVVHPGDSITLNFCRVVRDKDRTGLLFYIDPTSGNGDQNQIEFSLFAEIGTPVATPAS